MAIEQTDVARTPSSVAAAPDMDIASERAIVALINRAARLSDERKYLEWMDLFTDEASYSAITFENENAGGLYLFRDVGRAALHIRVAFLMGLWQAPRAKTLHVVSNVELAMAGEGSATGISNFIIARTADMEHSELHAAGTYYDLFRRADDGWRFSERRAVIDSNLLPPEFTELL
jgi:anthranilate 1,2-dioxygenase small subunit